MSLLQRIKKGVERSGSSKGKVLFVKADSKVRVRFLSEIEDGIEVVKHDHFERGIDVLCAKHLNKKCKFCLDEDLRTRNAYVWPVWDYEAKEVKLFIGFANNFNPLPSLIAMYEAYNTILDRDYIIQRTGSGMSTQYSVVPMDKVKFKNTKAKPYSEKKMIDLLGKAFPPTDDALTEDDNDDDDHDFEDDDNEDDSDYESMSPKDLYLECIERGLKAKKKQKKSYYVNLLEEDDEENEDDEDDWDDDEDDEDDDSDW